MNIDKEIKKLLQAILKTRFQLDREIESIHLEHPASDEHGDFATNIAMVLSKELKVNPREIATAIAEALQTDSEIIEKVEVAGPGFINFYVKDSVFKNSVWEVDENFGKHDLGLGKKVMVEFGQPNTHKAFHVGHLKSAISGLSMANLHSNLGYEVIKANYFGDVGMQAAKCTWGFIKKGKPSGFETWGPHEKMRFIDECYVFGANEFKENEAAAAEIKEINKQIYAGGDNEVVTTYQDLRTWSIEHQREMWKTLGIVYDREYPESEVAKDALEIVNKYKGEIFEESDGAIIFDGKKVGLTTWVFITGEGNPTYSAKDLGLAYRKFQEYPDLAKSIVTTSVEIVDYFKVVIHILEKILPESKGRYFHIPFGWMLFNNRKESSRTGLVPNGVDIIEEVKSVAAEKITTEKEYSEEEKAEIVWKVAIAGLKFFILSHEFHKDINYEPEKFLSLEGFSGPYLMYTYARARSILRNSEISTEALNIKPDLGAVFTEKSEMKLIKLLQRYPEFTMQAGLQVAPHLIANYLFELAQQFNSFYTEVPVLKAEEEVKLSRLKLVEAVAQALHNGLNLLGIETIERM